MVDWVNVFVSYRVVVLRREEIVQGVLHPELSADAPPVRSFLEEWSDARFVRETPLGTEVTLLRRTVPRVRERWWLHVLLFLLTLLSTTVSGALFGGWEPLRWVPASVGSWELALPAGIFPAQLVPGLHFSLPLLAILLAHELGHYLAARSRGMDVSPPYFIPAPLLSLIGTLGAFIRLRSPMLNRAVLLDVGAAGPIAGFLLAVPLAAAGLRHSTGGTPPYDTPTRFLVPVGGGGEGIWIGSSLLFDALSAWLAPPGEVVVLHPWAVAGWVGFFVTALNLFPLSQLDGGHILFALAGRRQRYAGLAFLAVLLFLGQGWVGWWIWAGLILVIGRGSVAHPPVFDPDYPVGRGRQAVGWACMAILVLTFVRVPFSL
ncbi:MAG TPA: site-2 protease family protein [Longimicrobiaceae bacterium]|nr:site-2 protease family protein [Longimicrobiaceae bacterium]